MNKTSITDAMRRAQHRAPERLSGVCYLCKNPLRLGAMLLEYNGGKRTICAKCLNPGSDTVLNLPIAAPETALELAGPQIPMQDSGGAPAGGLKPLGVSFTVWGPPMGKPRMTQGDKANYRPVTKRYWEWKAKAQDALLARDGIPLTPTIWHLSWVAYLPMPKSWSKKKRKNMEGTLHRQKPDRDNIDKAILDALFKDDSMIASGTLEKRWDDGKGPRVEITVL